MAADAVDHNAPSGSARGREGLAGGIAFYSSCLSDIEISIEALLEHGNRVVAYGVIAATHTGQLMHMAPIGPRVSFAYMDMHRTEDGRITESWHLEDSAGLLAHVDGLPSADQTEPATAS